MADDVPQQTEVLKDPLGDWLQGLSSDGDLDSQGGFSIAEEKAWEKLGAFQLPFDGAWILKLVQAAVSGGAESVKVVQTRSQTSLEFSQVEDWQWQDVQKLFFEIDSNSGSAIGHLAVALRALAKSVGNPFFVNFPGDCIVIWDGENFQTVDADGPVFEIKVSHLVGARVIKAVRFMTSIQKGAAL